MKLKAFLAVVAVASGLMVANVSSAASTYEVSPEKLGDRSDLSAKAVSERLERTGKVCLEGDSSCGGGGAATAAAASGPRDAKTVYNNVCSACHGTGAMNAPKVGDKAAWAPRVAQGEATLLKHALGGFNMMPPKGGCADCSDDEIKGVVQYFEAEAK
ncbi:MAG TPA: c-type cytochrome [Pseudomonadales bacterium]|nr:c-type cytochrome [Pseudomonadales bacterium]